MIHFLHPTCMRAAFQLTISAGMFELRRAYGVATFFSKHDVVNSYIARVVGGMRPWLLSGSVESVAIAVFSASTGSVRARYVFDVCVLAPTGAAAMATELAALDVQLRAHLVRILAEPAREVEDGGERSWDFFVRTTGVQTGKEWVPADGRERREIDEAVAVPIKDADGYAETAQIASRIEYPGEGVG